MKTQATKQDSNGIRVRKTVSIDKPPEALYEFWRAFENFPLFMEDVESVIRIDERTSHWKVKAPAGKTVEWDAEVERDVRNESIGWRAKEGSQIENAGVVTFRRGRKDRGTEVTVELTYHPPAGGLGDRIATLFGREPLQQLERNLRRFKALMETGEVPTAAMNPGQQPALVE
jgi:uncharacterized membrane protein